MKSGCEKDIRFFLLFGYDIVLSKGLKCMLLKQMEYFIAVVECQSFTEAAYRCYISQSAISQQIKILENELGVQLLKREGRHFSLTDSGQYFYQRCLKIVDDIDDLKEETRKRSHLQMKIRIGYPKNFQLAKLQQTVAQFCKLYPHINISIVSGTHEELYKLLVQGMIDVKISEQRRVFHQDYYNYELKKSDSYVEISSLHPLAKKECLLVEDIEDLKCIIVSSKNQEESERLFYETDLKIAHHFLYADSLEQARFMLLGQNAFLPIDLLEHEDSSIEGICRLPLYRNGKPIHRNYFMCWAKDNDNMYIEKFASLFYQLLHPNLYKIEIDEKPDE